MWLMSRTYFPVIRSVNFRTVRNIKTRYKLVLGFLLFVLIIHLYILPEATQSYNYECITSEKQLNDMRYLVRHITEAFDQLNQIYWIDYGTLLGYTRSRDIIPHDDDVDIGRLINPTPEKEKEFKNNLKKYFRQHNISANIRKPKYGAGIADLFTWKVLEQNPDLLYRIPEEKNESFVFKLTGYFAVTRTVPKNMILPTINDYFLGNHVQIPRDANSRIKTIYKYTHNIRFSYKWKCFFYYLFH